MLVQAFRVFPGEGAIVGRLLTGYTDIEYQLCFCAGMGGGDVAKAITDIYSKRGEKRRVDIAKQLGGAGYCAAGLGAEFVEAIEDMMLCRTIRNQYAHCIWHDRRVGKLAFAHMEDIASPTGPGADPINLAFEFVDMPLLNHQEQFFFYTRDTLNYLNYRRRQIVGEINAGATIRTPTKVARPLRHL
ncbi:hypothetical protein [Acidocella aminolytica]|uniref:Uncharacterized protein n=1 Tax=Acidocella aminolytica 101 = DSM 11237 TaxID=1120923 RepID=A0A0D6PN37_9PROT|nr:hypothetical protein [Acidocella aminolytica]GAN82204.1 hypothetical protein Aam_175_001 [Acidocella aminolytica 101 = DSM 11237]GBQ43602.1 hypothetical protein AA11237_3327 [Acidocella aminolytica 101 = DSM 11237]SHE67666.1 hypothetical protein SAMN02746095_01011 [Acidocella aminolytica 101 = DSM 11237]